MRKLLFGLLVLLLAGCQTARVVPWQGFYVPMYFDLTPYAEKGFLFTPLNYNLEYDAAGIVEVVYYPTIVKAPQDSPVQLDGYILKRCVGANCDNYYIQKPDGDSLIAEMYNLAVKLGADAVIMLTIEDITFQNDILQVESKKISGYAIKRKPVRIGN